jgi:hypothetical protein
LQPIADARGSAQFSLKEIGKVVAIDDDERAHK